MNRRSYLFWTVFLAAGIAVAVMALIPASQSVEAQAPSMSCMDIQERLATTEKQAVKYESYVDIKINAEPWRQKLGKLDRAIAAGDILNEANAICGSLSCTAIEQGVDRESRTRFLKEVRNILAGAIDEVLKTDAGKLSEDLASARRSLSAARADFRNKRCENIQVLSATYGGNCDAPQGNVTNSLMKECDGKELCSYRIDAAVLGDPVPRCAKDYVATWKCGLGTQVFTATADPEAGNGSHVILSCGR